jgi:hypothetical protein
MFKQLSLKLPRRIFIRLFITITIINIFLFSHYSFTKSYSSLEALKLAVKSTIKSRLSSVYTLATYSKYDLDSTEFLTHVEDIRAKKLASEESRDDLWDIDEDHTLPLNIEIPQCYRGEKKPVIQPFDPRFTIAVYYEYLRSLMVPAELQPKNLIKNNGDLASYSPDIFKRSESNAHTTSELTRRSGSLFTVPFHWSDWIDMSKLHKYFLNHSPQEQSNYCKTLFDIYSNADLIKKSSGLHKLKEYCVNDPSHPLGFRITQYSGQHTLDALQLLGKAYLHTSAPAPVKLVFLSQEGSYQVDVANDHANATYKNLLLHNGMVESLLEKNIVSHDLNVLESYTKLVKQFGVDKKFPVEHKIEIPEESFDFDAVKEVQRLSSLNNLTTSEGLYLDSLQNSLAERNPPKHFLEAKLLNSQPQFWLGEHYDWRFFDGFTLGNEEQLISLHRLTKSYLNFCRTNGITTWIAHGSLLSWYWNGIAFPWDSDIDVQMPIADLNKLARDFNQSLVVESAGSVDYSFDGMGRYFVDVGSSITYRTKGNGQNNIDARFIDVDSGLYIDITGLALTNQNAPDRYNYMFKGAPKQVTDVINAAGKTDHKMKNALLRAYNCRNNHFATLDELSPLSLSVVENQLSYIPNNFIVTLNYEYNNKALGEKYFQSHVFLENLRLWVHKKLLLEYLADRNAYVASHGEASDIEDVPIAEKDEKALTKAEKAHAKDNLGDLDKLRIDRFSVEDYLALLQDTNLLKDYLRSRKMTQFHQHELRRLLIEDFKGAAELLEEYAQTNTIGSGLHPDYFMYTIMKDVEKQSFISQVNKIIALEEMYDAEN